jgi:hypothetical protein
MMLLFCDTADHNSAMSPKIELKQATCYVQTSGLEISDSPFFLLLYLCSILVKLQHTQIFKNIVYMLCLESLMLPLKT